MKYILLLPLALLLSLNSFAGAGYGHSHGAPTISKARTKDIGVTEVKRLVKAGKLDVTWLKANFEKSIAKKFGNRKEWVVTFQNSKGVKGKKLYLFLSESGRFIAANFSGK